MCGCGHLAGCLEYPSCCFVMAVLFCPAALPVCVQLVIGGLQMVWCGGKLKVASKLSRLRSASGLGRGHLAGCLACASCCCVMAVSGFPRSGWLAVRGVAGIQGRGGNLRVVSKVTKSSLVSGLGRGHLAGCLECAF
jgi:hypothetical protein